MQHYPLEDGQTGPVTDTDPAPVHRHPRVLLLGAGELDAELVIAFQRLGAEVIAVAADQGGPAHAVADRSLVISLTDTEQVAAVIGRLRPDFVVSAPDAVTADALTVAAQAADAEVLPTPRSVRLAADPEALRRLAADELGLPLAPFWFAGSVAELAAVAEHAGYPLVVKPTGGGQTAAPGRGQSVLVRPDDVEPAWRRAVSAGATRVLAESVVETDCAVTLLTVAGVGETGPTLDFCNPIGHRWVSDGADGDGAILESWQPQPLGEVALGTARSVAARIVRALGGRGLFGVELLIRGDEVYFCDVTVRPGDSGLVTLRTQRLSQFELAARAVLGLGTDTIMISPGAARLLWAAPAAAVPELGSDAAEARAAALRVPESDISVFGPPEGAPRRRLAVALATAADAETARNRAAQVSAALRGMWRR